MKQADFFYHAKWVAAKGAEAKDFSVIRGKFRLNNTQRVTLNILGLGFFKCYINGVCINPDTFLPLSSHYDAFSAPQGETLSGMRVYVPEFDITPYVRKGENVIAVHFGGGWYLSYYECTDPKKDHYPMAIYCISAGDERFVSDEACRIGGSYVSDYAFTEYEVHDYRKASDCFGVDFDDSAWEHAVPSEGLPGEYCRTNCPADHLNQMLEAKKVGQGENFAIYDCGCNTTGYPVLEVRAKAGETVSVSFSEELLPNGELDPTHMHAQKFCITSDGAKRQIQPEFIWYGFRYFAVEGEAEVLGVKEIFSDVPVSSTFRSDNETLNWIYQTFVHTMQTNLHLGHPSDCPHIERRGYTGDGQLTCHAVLSMFDAKAFYEKWLQDIADGQDAKSGHIQYTAPYVSSGGGPGGWGEAIVEVPYRLYQHYGDQSVLEKYYENMRKYISYLEAHSEFGLVTSDKEGAWCLGDWCGPNILYPEKDITFSEQQIFLPAAYVNTYFMVKALQDLCKIAKIIGNDADIAEYEEKLKTRKAVMRAAYFNTFDGNFFMNAQGANAFAVDLDLGDERTYASMVDYYQKLGHLDTGIFATDILIRTLFEHGDGALATELLIQDGEQGFEHWRKNGATTFHEYWDSNRSRSHNHPMFGAVTAYFFEYLLGIKQKEDCVGYRNLIIEPAELPQISEMSGSMQTTLGEVSVAYRKENGKTKYTVQIPDKTEAVFRNAGKDMPLFAGENVFLI